MLSYLYTCVAMIYEASGKNKLDLGKTGKNLFISSAIIQGDYCAKINVNIIGFFELPILHRFAGVYIAMEDESTNNGKEVKEPLPVSPKAAI